MTFDLRTMDAPPVGLGEPPAASGNYIIRHWRGALPLPQSYWVNGVLLGLPFSIYFQVITLAFQAQPPESPLPVFWLLIVPFLLWQPVLIWQGVGIWRSAGHRIADGRRGWALVARTIVFLNIFAFLYSGAVYAKLAYSETLAYFDQKNARFEMSSANGVVSFSGLVTPASADRLIVLLEDKKVTRLLIKQSVGGFMLPALRIAQIVHDRGLTVVATRQCASMCTVILAAGKQRFIAPTLVLQLHTGTMVGTNDSVAQWDQALDWYKRAGMGSELLAKISAHRGIYDVYEPTLREIIDNGLATHIFHQRLQLYVAAKPWCDENALACSRTGRENLNAMLPAKR